MMVGDFLYTFFNLCYTVIKKWIFIKNGVTHNHKITPLWMIWSYFRLDFNQSNRIEQN